jgi:hypothetical protein
VNKREFKTYSDFSEPGWRDADQQRLIYHHGIPEKVKGKLNETEKVAVLIFPRARKRDFFISVNGVELLLRLEKAYKDDPEGEKAKKAGKPPPLPIRKTYICLLDEDKQTIVHVMTAGEAKRASGSIYAGIYNHKTKKKNSDWFLLTEEGLATSNSSPDPDRI